jgi:hypothetical protein
MTFGLVVRCERQPRQLMTFGAIAFRAGHAGAAAFASVPALPWSIGMVLADPTAIIAPATMFALPP